MKTECNNNVMTQKKIEETEKGRDVEEKVNQPINFLF